MIKNQDPNELWEAPDSWGVQPAGTPSQEPHLFENEATEYDDYSAMEPRNYGVQRKNVSWMMDDDSFFLLI